MKKKWLLMLLISTLVVGGVTACGEAGGNTSEDSAAVETAASESQTSEAETSEEQATEEAAPETDSIIDPSNMEEVKQFYHDTFVANLPESYFKNHKSYSTTWSMPLSETALDEYHYCEEKLIYNEWSDGYKESFSKAGYGVTELTSDETVEIKFGVNINENPSELDYHCLMPKDEELAVDLDKEVFDRAYEEDGLLYICSHFNEEGTSSWIEANLGRSADGESISMVTVADPETYEFFSMTYYLEKDGKEEVAFEGTVQYDVDMPSVVDVLWAPVERSTENITNVTLIVDYGTDKEETYDFQVPTNTEVVWFYNGENVSFDDPDYTTMSHWNRMDDRTIYVVRDPDEELIERYNKLRDEVLEKMQSEQEEAEETE